MILTYSSFCDFEKPQSKLWSLQITHSSKVEISPEHFLQANLEL